MDQIIIHGARSHNLKNVTLSIPRNKLNVFTGLSGSGKSSLAFDTLYAEGQRRYIESVSPYARQFMHLMQKPDVDNIEGLSPAISIDQKSTSSNPRSTVGTVTEIMDYMRLLFARTGIPYCPTHHLPLSAQPIAAMVDATLALPERTGILILAPVSRGKVGDFAPFFKDMFSRGFTRFRLDGEVQQFEEIPILSQDTPHDVDVVVDRLRMRADMRERLAESFQSALELAAGRVIVLEKESDVEHSFSAKHACPLCDFTMPPLEPQLFSFNSPHGACKTCNGLGVASRFDPSLVVAVPALSLYAGAIPGWDRRNGRNFNQLQIFADRYGIDLNMPYCELPLRHRNLVLYGKEAEGAELNELFEGVMNALERQWKTAKNASMRTALERYRSEHTCPDCHGLRLCEAARNVYIGEGELKKNIGDIAAMSLHELGRYFAALFFEGARAAIAEKLLIEIRSRLGFLNDVGVGYLSLTRSADTLSGGESQRIRLASQIGSRLTGVTYVLDEPSIGLHQRDNDKLLATLFSLRDLGNTIVMVEHDEDAMRNADYLVDMGPGAGEHGGEVVACGTPDEIMANSNSLTGAYLSGRKQIPVPKKRKAPKNGFLKLVGACGNNLKNVTLEIPAGLITVVSGVSGSGKSSLINDTLEKALSKALNHSNTQALPYERIENIELFDKVISVEQSPIGRTPRSNPATYTGVFSAIREVFAQTHQARERGYDAGRFSFNTKGGRCEACGGDGVVRVEMNFLSDVYVSCDVCHGQRYNRETLDVQYKGLNISQVLNLTIEEAKNVFAAHPVIVRKLQALIEVGLGYIRLGQSAITFSGGEAQRIKLATELAKRETGHTLYILDEPTTGLHFEDIVQLMQALRQLTDNGNTVVIIEHNLDVLKVADWVIDMGPEGGDGGGQILVAGTPETVAENKKSVTGPYLKVALDRAKNT